MPQRFVWIEGALDPYSMELHGPVCLETRPDGSAEPASQGCPPGSPREELVLLPGLCNAHIHVLDAYILDTGEDMELHEMVAHPTGLKYRLLVEAAPAELENAAFEALRAAKSRGTVAAGVYAELGFPGAEVAARASRRAGVEARILPQPLEKSSGEYNALIAAYGGLGLDTPLDLASRTPLEGHIHVHVGEDPALASMDDLSRAADLGARAAVHLTHVPEGAVWEAARSWHLYPVLCPRSNLFFQARLPPVRVLVNLWDEGLPAGLGSDNAAWLPPDVAAEMSAAYIAARVSVEPGLRRTLARAILYAATAGCTRLLGIEPRLWILVEAPGVRLSGDPVVSLVKRLYMFSLRGFIPVEGL